MAFHDRKTTREILLAGGIAGMIAGLAMAMVAMVHGLASGSGFWLPVRLIAATVFGVNALIGGAGVLAVGLMIHMAVSAMWGIAFALFVSRTTSVALAFGGGLVYAVGVWAVMTYGVLPVINPTMYDRAAGITPGWFFVEHLVYGTTLLVTPPLMRVFAPQRAMVEEERERRRRAA